MYRSLSSQEFVDLYYLLSNHIAIFKSCELNTEQHSRYSNLTNLNLVSVEGTVSHIVNAETTLTHHTFKITAFGYILWLAKKAGLSWLIHV